MHPARVFQVITLALVFLVSTTTGTTILNADGTLQDPMLLDQVPQIDLSEESLLIDLVFDVEPDSSLTLTRHQFRKDIPTPAIATPWFWAARAITFDNKCSQLTPLEDPTVLRVTEDGSHDEEDSDHDHDEFWGKITSPTTLSVELVVDEQMTEVEIIGSSYESLGVFDVAVFIDGYCDNNPEDGICINRKNRIILLDTDDGLDTINFAIADDFGDLPHLSRVGARDGYKVVSANENPVLSVDMNKTVLTWDLAHIPTSPFNSTSKKGVYNAHDKYQTPEGLDPDSALIVMLEEPALGMGFTLGIMNHDHLTGKDETTNKWFKHLETLGNNPSVTKVEEVFAEIQVSKDPITVLLSAYDSNGLLINQKERKILPVPGMYSFVGLIAPNTEIQKVVIEYRSTEFAAEEFLTDLIVFPLDTSKLPYRPRDINEQPCESPILLHTGEMADFLPIDEVERLRGGPDRPDPISPPLDIDPEPGSDRSALAANQTPREESRPIFGSCNSNASEGVDLASVGWPMLILGLFVHRAFNSSKK